MPGYSPVNDAPREKYSLYTVHLERLGKPASGSDRPSESAPPASESS
jgi:hypothetical protein